MIKEQIEKELIKCIKQKDKDRLEVMRSIKTAFTNLEKFTSNLSDSDYIMLLKKLAKQRKETAEVFNTANRFELFDKEMYEFEVISEFLPKSLSEEEVKQLIFSVIHEEGLEIAKFNMGKIVKLTVSKASGQTDGKVVSTLVNKIITESAS